MQTPQGCTLTTIAALNIAEKFPAGNPDASGPGYQKPALDHGSDLMLEIEGIARQKAEHKATQLAIICPRLILQLSTGDRYALITCPDSYSQNSTQGRKIAIDKG